MAGGTIGKEEKMYLDAINNSPANKIAELDDQGHNCGKFGDLMTRG